MVTSGRQRIRVLLGWFGSGAGPWSGFPVYEDVPARMLLEYPAPELIAAVQGAVLTGSEKTGAARFFSCYTHRGPFRMKDDMSMIGLLPLQMKRTLLEHVLKSGDKDNIDRARSSFE